LVNAAVAIHTATASIAENVVAVSVIKTNVSASHIVKAVFISTITVVRIVV
jgi:hypothetical protein